ncbi:replication initiation protein [Xanthocytophaga agilis]|uniref:Replication initiation protein n=1 Tax=Xanthocytophaga agilis TaxID=3048010 RepID=A0AAE3R8M5_9BACT|nr:replication initiation protein [Xanthocytophaga agilis]MDJ1505265.1 replication initiation protein [Xanthocytophaga agilis]
MAQLSIFQEQKNPAVRMHNNIVWARFPYLEESEMKIFLLMFAHLPWNIEELPVCRIAVKDVIPYHSGERYPRIKQACRELKRKFDSVEINRLVNGKEGFRLISAISFIDYLDGNDFIEAKFSEEIKPYLIQMKGNFTTVELFELFSLKTSGAMRFYIMIKSCIDAGIHFRDTLDNIRGMFFGKEEKYEEYKVFKRDFLLRHQKALENTLSAFEFEEHKKGKTVVELTFKPLKKASDRYNLPTLLEKQLKSYNVNLATVVKLITANEVEEEYVAFVLKHTAAENSSKKSNKKLDGGYILNRLKDKSLYQAYLDSVNPSLPLPEQVEPATKKKNSRQSSSPSPSATITYKEQEVLLMYQDAQKRRGYAHDLEQYMEEIFFSNGFIKVLDGNQFYLVKSN